MQGGTLDSIPAPAAWMDGNRCIIEVNSAAARLFQKEPEELVGQPVDPLIAQGDIQTSPGEVQVAEGKWLLIFSDSPLQRRMQQEIYHLSRLASVGKLVTTVVHEINNSLSGILGYTQLALQAAPAGVSADLQRAYEAALRTSQVVQNLLRFSRQGERKRTRVDLGKLLQRCAEMKRRDFALRSIEFELESQGLTAEVEGDESLLFQVFINLLNNAESSILSVRERGSIQVKVKRSGRKVTVDVRDDGAGVPLARMEKIFEPFYSSRLGRGGTGLGLTLCREILTEHGGEIRLLRNIRRGAAFRIGLPAAALPADGISPQPPPARPPAVRNRRIVVIEDEPDMREVMSRAFAGHGNHTVTFERGEDALAYLLTQDVDLIISDVHRPGLDGIRLYQQLVRRIPRLGKRFLFITGDTMGEQTAAFLRRTHVPCLPKPLLIPDLLEKSRELLEQPMEQGELFR